MPKDRLLSTKIVCACCSTGSTIASLGCMAIMTTTIAATGAVAMGVMSANSVNFSLKLLNFIGLGFLTRIDLKILESILIVLLLAGIISAYFSYRFHQKNFPLILTIVSSILIYISIFVVMSNSIYYISLIGLILGTILNLRGKKK